MSHTPLDPYVTDVLMPDLVGHERSPSAFVVYLYLWRQTIGRRRTAIRASYQTIATETGLSKAGAQRAVAILKRRKLLSAVAGGPVAVPRYRVVRPWIGRLPPAE
ncbi:MAG: helix-turn-helix domain-containing protein [Gammaproteobacteria bacterium]|nr:helix-turn-helix domain-containing protein [Gammaproteobacteria bacterium]